MPSSDPLASLDYGTAFDLAPIGLVLSRNRLMVACNQQVLEMFGARREALVGHSFELLYPTHDEFERTGARIVASLNANGGYADERVMKRVGGAQRDKLFWCRVAGRTLDPAHPHAAGIWSFEDLSARRQIGVELTPRTRDRRAADRGGADQQADRPAPGHQPAHRRRLPRAADGQVCGGKHHRSGSQAAVRLSCA